MPDRTQLELLYVKVTKSHKMSFDAFIEALEQIATTQSVSFTDLIMNFI